LSHTRPSSSGHTPPDCASATIEWTPNYLKLSSAEQADRLEPHSIVIPNPFGRYSIQKLLGRGGMGAVFLAFDENLQRQVALKIPLFHDGDSGAWKERFLREARAVANLRHPNLCPVFDVGEEQGILYLTMAYIDGVPLTELIARGPRSLEEALHFVCISARAMQVAHLTGVIHRDLKPANILIDSNKEPVIMDFGLARKATWIEEQGTDPADRELFLTQFGSILGTLPYMPPEQARGDLAALGPWSDVYSLGVILFELLTNRRPFDAPTVKDLVWKIENEPPPRPTAFYPWIDPVIETVCLKALAKDPGDRYQSMREFEEALAPA
jgi:serine/threonine protein kinase